MVFFIPNDFIFELRVVGGSIIISPIASPPLTACGNDTEIAYENLTAQQVSACKADVQEYMTAFNEVQGISVPGGPPYNCPNDDSLEAPPPTSIPTLSEWGLLAIAAVLCIVGYIFIRKREVAV